MNKLVIPILTVLTFAPLSLMAAPCTCNDPFDCGAGFCSFCGPACCQISGQNMGKCMPDGGGGGSDPLLELPLAVEGANTTNAIKPNLKKQRTSNTK